jgi:hypothetical protein
VERRLPTGAIRIVAQLRDVQRAATGLEFTADWRLLRARLVEEKQT